MEEDLTKIEQRINDLITRTDEQITEGGVDMPTILTYVKYFVEHLKDLLIDHCNPIMQGRYFGVIFDQTPSYSEIDCGTAEISKIPGMNELFKLADPGIVDLVRMRGLEPPRLAALAPKTSVSTIPPHPHRGHRTNLRFFLPKPAKMKYILSGWSFPLGTRASKR